MPTFQRTETIDAREFTGGFLNGAEIVFWVNSNQGIALYDRDKDVIRLSVWGEIFTVHPTDMVVLQQDGRFNHIRQEDFKILGYKQV